MRGCLPGNRPVLNVVLLHPEIPPNTGNLIRLCANSGATLHLIEPLGFSMEEKALRRAGLDYHEAARVRRWASLGLCWEALGAGSGSALGPASGPAPEPASGSASEPATIPVSIPRTWAATTRGDRSHTEPRYRAGDILLFGPESRGLPETVLADPRVTARLRVPMRPGSRSLNLSNAVSIVLYEAWRQLGFEGAGP